MQPDGWSAVLRPPEDESAEERRVRIARQHDAARISKEIDDAIDRSRRVFERRKKAVKILLLGQAESGKSTMLRNFQLAFCPTSFHAEIPVWKIVIQLNLIGSLKRLLAILDDELAPAPPPDRPPDRPRPFHAPSPSVSSRSTSLDDPPDPPLTQAHAALRLRLLPLLSIAHQLFPECSAAPPPPSSTGWTKWASGTGSHSFGNGEICVRAGGAWKRLLEHVTGSIPDTTPDGTHSRPQTASGRHARPHPSDPTPLLEALAHDIHTLWTDPAVQALLRRNGVYLEHSAGFFLNDILRIGKPGWKPDIDDIVRARVRTFGVEEHKFVVNDASEWYIYDVGGSRGSRHQWVPYFDDVQAIIFLAPLAFNQVLDEDGGVNRLEDSMALWREVCASPLLARTNVILFLNKMDILESTLESGVRVQSYISAYGSNPNDLEHVVKYFRERFRAYHRRLSPKPRTFFCHGTSAIDTAATQAVLAGVREGILKSHLEKLSVI